MVSLARANQNGIPQARIVRYTVESENPGFLLTRTGALANPRFWALFNDAYTEEINPPAGAPRPNPDPAERTKRQAIPTSLRGAGPYVLGSMFSGQMRNVVQCEFSRGANTRFSHTWAKTHGLLEFPHPHVSGSDKNAEAIARSKRQYFVIEISSAGVYAAPVKFGITCSDCALVSEYLIGAGSSLDLAAFYAANPNGKTQRVLTASQIAPAYSAGAPWYGGCGWAFSYSGLKASNVVARVDNGAGFQAYLTTHFRLQFSVTLPGERTVTIVRFGSMARVYLLSHGFDNADIVAITGADQDEYNGAHVVVNATDDTFEFALNGAPASPATGNIKVANLLEAGAVGGSLTQVEQGRVTFQLGSGGTLWAPVTTGLWEGVQPAGGPPRSVSGPVHVYYDGESEIVTRWSQSVSNATQETIDTVAGATLANDSYINEGDPIEICQSPFEFSNNTLITSYTQGIISAHGFSNYGFHGDAFDARGVVYSRGNVLNVTTPAGSKSYSYQYSNRYALRPECYWVDENGQTRDGGTGLMQVDETHQLLQTVQQRFQEDAGLTSSLVLFYEEREAVAALKLASTRITGSYDGFVREYRDQYKEEKISGDDAPFTAIDSSWAGTAGSTGISLVPTTSMNSVGASGQFTVAGVGFSESRGVPIVAGEVASPYFSDFVRYTIGEKTTAQSGLYFIRGGLYYDEPQLVPQNQRNNRVFDLGDNPVTQGGFEQLNGKFSIGFVGQV